MRQRPRALVIFGGLLFTVGVSCLYAHATFLRSDPVAGSLLQTAPGRVRIWFSEPIEAAADPLVVTDPAGARVDNGARVAPDDKTSLEAGVRASAQGTYTVHWSVISEDGHPVGGRFRFSVGKVTAGAATSANNATDDNRGVVGQSLSRWLHLLGATIALGALFMLVILPEAMPDEVRRRLLSTSLFGALLLLCASPAMLLAQTVASQGSLDVRGMTGVVQSHWGRLWLARLACAGVLTVAVWLARAQMILQPFPRRRALTFLGLLAGLGLLLFTSANGHSIATPPVLLTMSLDVAHLAATVVWLGGLFALMLAVAPGLSRTISDRRVAHLGDLIGRFSTIAFVCVELLLVTGLYQTWAHVDSPASLVQTGYGRVLLIKLGLFTLVLLPAALNLLVMRPRFEAERGQTLDIETGENNLIGPFTRMVSIEALLGFGILGAAALLSAMPPARSLGAGVPPTPAMAMQMSHEMTQPALSLSAPAHGHVVTVTLDPARTGSNHATVEARDSLGQLVALQSGRIRTVPPQGAATSPSVSTLAADNGGLHATLGLDAPGVWKLEVSVVGPNGMAMTAVVPVRVLPLAKQAADPEAS